MPSRYSEAVYQGGAVSTQNVGLRLVVYKFHNLSGMSNLISTQNYFLLFLQTFKLKLIYSVWLIKPFWSNSCTKVVII